MFLQYLYPKDKPELALDVLYMIKETNGSIEAITYTQDNTATRVLTSISRSAFLDFDIAELPEYHVGLDIVHVLEL